MLLNARGEQMIQGGAVSITATAPEAIQYVPPVTAEQVALWQAELDLIAPESPHVSSLKLVWVPGDDWAVVNRWFIYQMMPVGIIPFSIDVADLKRPDPRTYAGYFDEILQRYITKQQITIDRMQWLLYQETGRYGFPYWVVQGTKGGHLRRFTSVQVAVAKLEGGFTDPPAPGDLPYAAPDNRTWAGLREFDSLVKYDGLLAFHLRSPEMVQGAEKEKAEQMRKRMWNQLRGQQEGIWGDEGSVIRNIKDSLPTGLSKTGKGVDYEDVERRFVED